MSTSLEPQQQPPPPMEVTQQAYTSGSGHGSVGPVIGVLAVVAILGAIAVMIGRLCSGRKVIGHGQYDFEGWVEAKCGSCIDGRIDPPTPRPRPPPPPPLPRQSHSSRVESGRFSSGRISSSVRNSSVPEAGPTESGQEAREEEVTRPDPAAGVRSLDLALVELFGFGFCWPCLLKTLLKIGRENEAGINGNSLPLVGVMHVCFGCDLLMDF